LPIHLHRKDDNPLTEQLYERTTTLSARQDECYDVARLAYQLNEEREVQDTRITVTHAENYGFPVFLADKSTLRIVVYADEVTPIEQGFYLHLDDNGEIHLRPSRSKKKVKDHGEKAD
jgi:hypothetical protein